MGGIKGKASIISGLKKQAARFLPALLLLFFACIEEFTPQIAGTSNLLVVEGLITGDPLSSRVRLSRSTLLNEAAVTPEAHAVVNVIDENGIEYPFWESTDGNYKAPEFYRGVPGTGYKLQVQTEDGQVYESALVTLKAVPPIDSVYFDYAYRFNEESNETEHGIELFLDSEDKEGVGTPYYRWEWEETYEILLSYPSKLDFVAGQVVERDTAVGQCFVTNGSSGILLGTTVQYDKPKISGKLLHFVSGRTRHLRSRYSLLVKQYALSEEGFRYWQELSKVNQNLGTLFDPQPYKITGNIRNIYDTEEPVLGFFDAALPTEKRIFIRKIDITGLEAPFVQNCKTETAGSVDEVTTLLFHGYKIVQFLPMIGYIMAPDWCSDCSSEGVLEPPEYW